jgi:hypothetical protein
MASPPPPLPELVPLPDTRALTALRRLDNRHQQRDQLLNAAAGDAGTFQRIADEVAAPVGFGRDDNERIRPAREFRVSLDQLPVAGLARS